MLSDAPASIAVSERGKRIVFTTIAAVSSPGSAPMSASITRRKGNAVEPSASDNRKTTASAAISPPTITVSRFDIAYRAGTGMYHSNA